MNPHPMLQDEQGEGLRIESSRAWMPFSSKARNLVVFNIGRGRLPALSASPDIDSHRCRWNPATQWALWLFFDGAAGLTLCAFATPPAARESPIAWQRLSLPTHPNVNVYRSSLPAILGTPTTAAGRTGTSVSIVVIQGSPGMAFFVVLLVVCE